MKDLGRVIPVNVAPMAMFAGYLGLFSLLMIPAPFAILTGIMALVHLRKHPEKQGKVRAWIGVTLGVVGTIMLGLVIYASLAP